MFQRILVPLDGSDEAATALPVAVELARRFEAELLLVEMVELGGAQMALATDVASGAMTDPNLIAAEVEAREQTAEGYISGMADQLASEGLRVSSTIGTGGGGDGIVAAAEAGNADLIVMATHARSGLGRLIFGSVTDHVIRHAGIPVLAIPLKDHDDKGEHDE